MALNFDINLIPAMQPPPGVQPNFVDPVTMYPAVLGVAIATIIPMTISIAIRIFTKAYLLRDMRIEEYFALIASAGIIVWDAMFVSVSYDGFSRHLWDVRAVDVHHLSYMNYTAEISNAFTMFFAKASILLQLKRLFCVGERTPIYWSIHILLFLNTAYAISAMFTFIFQCSPREKTWNPLMEGQCINIAAAVIAQGCVNLFLDLGILITPIWAIWHLQLPMKRKLGISAVFGVGIVTCAIAAVGVSLRVPLLTDGDLTWIITKVGIWAMVEYFGTILVGCMPTFPRFVKYIRGRDGDLPGPSTGASKSKSNKSLPRPGTGNSNLHGPGRTVPFGTTENAKRNTFGSSGPRSLKKARGSMESIDNMETGMDMDMMDMNHGAREIDVERGLDNDGENNNGGARVGIAITTSEESVNRWCGHAGDDRDGRVVEPEDDRRYVPLQQGQGHGQFGSYRDRVGVGMQKPPLTTASGSSNGSLEGAMGGHGRQGDDLDWSPLSSGRSG